MVSVETGARLHFGFQNLSPAHPRLYGGVGVGLREPSVVLDAERGSTVECDDDTVEPYLRAAVETLGVGGARVTVRERFPRHVGLGSGTQLALACLAGVARAYGREPAPRERAPALGRGGRSGVGVATFERGGFVVDIGHPTAQFSTDPARSDSWDVPPLLGRWSPPEKLRFVLVVPTADPGPSGDREDSQMRAVVEQADPGVADEIATLLTRRLLPAAATGDVEAFGRAVGRLGRLNGGWYTDEQGGVYRPPADELVAGLADADSVVGAGQSSWGPAVYGVTTVEDADRARVAAERALETVDSNGTVRLVRPSDTGVTVRE